MPLDPDGAGRDTASERRPRRGVVLGEVPFLIVFASLALTLEILEPQSAQDVWFRRAELTALASAVLAFAVPWHRVSRHWALSVPVLQLAAVVMGQQSGVEVAVLAVLPVVWLAGAFGRPGLVLAVVGAVIAGWDADVLVSEHVVVSRVSSAALLPVTLGAVAVVVSVLSSRLNRQRRGLERQEATLTAALDEARMQRALLDRVVDTIDVAVVVIAADGTLTLRNAGHRALVPLPGEVGESAAGLAGVGGYRADGVTPLGEAGSPMLRAARGESFSRELTWWDAGGGAPRAMRVSARPLLDADGRLLQGVVAYQDVTAEMRALAERDDLVAAVSHELRTPLTAIIGYLDLASEEPGLTPALYRDVDIARRNARRLLLLIDDLLTAGAVDRDDVTLNLEPVDLHELVARCVEGQRPVAERSGVTVVDETTAAGTVVADEHRLTQVVDNLLSNAVKYSRPGGHVLVSADRGPDTVRLATADDGIGISPADQEHLFERFFRAPAARRTLAQGTGLGMYIARHLVQKHGGTIAVSSATGDGTTVVVELPIDR